MVQQLHLVGGEEGARQHLQEKRFQHRQPEWQRHQQAAAAGFPQDDFHQFLEAVGHRPAQLIGLAVRRLAGQRRADGGGDVAHEHRLEPGEAGADQGQGGRDARQAREAVEEIIFRPENDGGPKDGGGGKRRAHPRFAFGFGLGISGGGFAVRADGGDMHQRLDARPGAAASAIFRAPSAWTSSKLWPPPGIQNAGEIDHGIGAGSGGGDLIRIGDVAFQRGDLAHRAGGTEEKGLVGFAHADPDAPAGPGQSPDRVAADKAGAPEDRDQLAFL